MATINDYPAKTELNYTDRLIISRDGNTYSVPFGVLQETIVPNEGE